LNCFNATTYEDNRLNFLFFLTVANRLATNQFNVSDISPNVILPPDAAHAPAMRAFQGIPSLALSPRTIWVTWYAGSTPHEDHNNYVVLSSSGDAGQTWREQAVIDPDGDGPVRAFDPQLWCDPQGRLWWFWTQGVLHQGALARVWAMTCDNPDTCTTWSTPRIVARGVMMNKPLVRANGEWMLPVSTWRECDDSAGVVVSTDNGATWQRRGGANVPLEARSYDEHSIIELHNGTIVCYVRTNYGIGMSRSTDNGHTWAPLKPSSIPNANARFFVGRLQSGNLLLVKHGSMTEQIGRSHLTALLSQDDGETWEGGLLLDERDKVSYPDGQQATDGTILITYDRERTGAREINLATFREDDVITGNTASPTANLRQRVNV